VSVFQCISSGQIYPAGFEEDVMTDVEKYLFDLRGYIVIEDVLNADQVTDLNRLIDENHPGVSEDSNKKHAGGFLTWGQALVDLIDHEAIMPRLKFILGDGFRLDHYYAIYMEQGGTDSRLHGANTPYDPPEYYHYREGRMYNGLTVVTFNLADSGPEYGGFCCIPGSHKGAYSPPKSTEDRNCDLWEDYECPAGSALIFSEAITHTGARWENEEIDRVAVFNCYNVVGNKWHKWEPHPQHVAEMPFKRQTLFRPVYCQDNVPEPDSI